MHQGVGQYRVHYDTVPRLRTILDSWNIVHFIEFFIVFYELGLILNPFRSCLKVFKRHWGSVSAFRSYPTICIGEKLILDGWVSSPFYFMIWGQCYLFRCSVKVFKRHWSSVSLFWRYWTICSGGNETFDGSVSSWSYFMILVGFILHLFRCCLKVLKRHWGSVSPFRSYPTICI